MNMFVKLRFWLLFPLSIISTQGDVELNPSGLASVSCGEVASIACHATGTNTISFAVATETQSFGSHTFERNSPRSAKVGPLELTLLEAVADPRNPFLTIFNVNGSEKHVMSYLMINCTDAISTRHVEIKTTRQSCNVPVHWGYSENSVIWEAPACKGWEDLLYYTVTYTTSTKKFIKIEVKEPFTVVPYNVSHVDINATNVCGETCLIGTISTDGAKSKDNFDREEMKDADIIVGVPVAAVGVVTLCCVLLTSY